MKTNVSRTFMLKTIEFLLITAALIVIILACNLSTIDQNPRIQALQSKVELVAETSNDGGKFSGNTVVAATFKNHERLVQEQEQKIKRNELKAEDKITAFPAGGQLEIKLEAASEETADLYKIEIWLTAKGERKRYLPENCDFVQGVKFSHVDEQYNLRIYTNLVRINLPERSIEPLALEIVDNHVGKTTKFNIYPYYNK